jgi:ABC-type branched-subunit amino acid transport system ATPase component
MDAMSLCEIAPLADRGASTLSTAERRRVELARCLAGPFNLLLLDEPTAGLDLGETQHLAEILRRVVADRELGILLVEHDTLLVLDLCDHVYVLDFGSVLIDGPPDAVARSPLARSAYLGTAFSAPWPTGSIANASATPYAAYDVDA